MFLATLPTGEPDTFALRAEVMLRRLLDAHTACAYNLDGQDRAKGRRAYARLVALAGGPEGAPEPEDKDSCAWYCWTMRRIRAGFWGDPDKPEDRKRYGDAWREVDSLAFGIFGGASVQRTGVNYELSCLPALVKAKQWDEHWKRKGARGE